MAVEAKRKRASRGIGTFVHLSCHLSGAVITATGGSLLFFGAQSESKERCQRENTVGEFRKMQGPRRDRFAPSPHC